MGAKLRMLGISDFTIFEQGNGIGGTWWDNIYPGAEVDTAVPFYSFSFHPFDFTRTHVTQPELLRYLENMADRFQLREHVRLSTRVQRVVWDEKSHTYDVFTPSGDPERFDVVVSAVGLLNHPNLPDWPGLDAFSGPKFHSSRWDQSVDMRNRTVAIVGTGSTSAQMVPALAPTVSKLYVFQRQPGWVVPKLEREFTALERAKLSRPWRRRWMRFRQATVYERNLRAKVPGTRRNLAGQAACERYISSVFADRPDLQKMVTPDYPYLGKRIVKDSNFYPALLRDNVELIPHAVESLTENEIIDETGCRRAIDLLVMCTGFQPSNFLATFEIVGRGGRTIHDVWKGEPRAFLGLMVTGFPNFYMLYGPNTNGAPIMFMHERQVNFVAAQLRRMMRTGITAIEVRQKVLDGFIWFVKRRLSHSVVAKYPEVHNYGRAPTGRDVISWQDGMTTYALLTLATRRIATTGRRLPTVRNGAQSR